MSFSIKRRTALRYLASAMMACPLVGHAQGALPGGWPNRPVKFVVPSGPGAQTDLFARYIAEHLARQWKGRAGGGRPVRA